MTKNHEIRVHFFCKLLCLARIRYHTNVFMGYLDVSKIAGQILAIEKIRELFSNDFPIRRTIRNGRLIESGNSNIEVSVHNRWLLQPPVYIDCYAKRDCDCDQESDQRDDTLKDKYILVATNKIAPVYLYISTNDCSAFAVNTVFVCVNGSVRH